jgi:hypothetical protein
MAAFIPGESPPEVNTAIFLIFVDMKKIKPTKLLKLIAIKKYYWLAFETKTIEKTFITLF